MRTMLPFFAVAVFVSGCHSSPTSPRLISEDQVAVTPSNEVIFMRLMVQKDGVDRKGSELLTVTIGENPQAGMSRPIGADHDWNEATIEYVWLCNGREAKVVANYSNDVDPVTGKRTFVLKRVPTCPGKVDFRLRVVPYGSNTPLDFDFPNPSRQLRLSPDTLLLVRDANTGFVYIRGTA